MAVNGTQRGGCPKEGRRVEKNREREIGRQPKRWKYRDLTAWFSVLVNDNESVRTDQVRWCTQAG
jgi:hypothetical protein